MHLIKEKYNPKNFPPKFDYYYKKYNEEKFGLYVEPSNNNKD